MSLNTLKKDSHIINEDGNEVFLKEISGEYFLEIKTDTTAKIELSKEDYEYLGRLIESSDVAKDEPTEIEKKYLIKYLPENFSEFKKTKIDQGYVIITSSGTELRVRNKAGKFLLTIKKGKGKTRVEGEINIKKENFDELWKMTKGRTVEKTRYTIPYRCEIGGIEKEFTIELDIFEGRLAGIKAVEVEFESEEDSNLFVTPPYFGDDLTDDKRFKNQNLAIIGEENLESLKKEICDRVAALLR